MSKPSLPPKAHAIYRTLALGGRWTVKRLAGRWTSEGSVRNHLQVLQQLGLAYRYPQGSAAWGGNGGSNGSQPDAWVAIDPRGAAILDPIDIIGDPS